MKYCWLLLLILLTGSCQQKNSSLQISLDGKTLRGTVTSGTDSFSNVEEGYQFSTHFISKNRFETKNAAGVLESAGQYSFQKNKLILQSDQGLHPQETIEVILKFTDSKSGVYEAHFLSGISGEETGIFSLQ